MIWQLTKEDLAAIEAAAPVESSSPVPAAPKFSDLPVLAPPVSADQYEQPKEYKPVANPEHRKKSIRRGYATAVVKDAVAKARKFLKNKELSRAKAAIWKAQQTLEDHRSNLGAELSGKYGNELQQMQADMISGS